RLNIEPSSAGITQRAGNGAWRWQQARQDRQQYQRHSGMDDVLAARLNQAHSAA
ncbi:hypothetical protein ISX56_30805, partial [Serratia ureilytica]|nr:hypothetical protein [Serratia ureilytica]